MIRTTCFDLGTVGSEGAGEAVDVGAGDGAGVGSGGAEGRFTAPQPESKATEPSRMSNPAYADVRNLIITPKKSSAALQLRLSTN